jgi:hypothetical protein
VNIDWTWLLIGLLVGVFFGGQLRGAVGSIKSKATG